MSFNAKSKNAIDGSFYPLLLFLNAQGNIHKFSGTESKTTNIMKTKTLKLILAVVALAFIGCTTDKGASSEATPENKTIFLESNTQKMGMIGENTTAYLVTYENPNITYGEKQDAKNKYIDYLGLFAYDTTEDNHIEIWYIDDLVNIPDECINGCTINGYTYPALCSGCGKDIAIENDDIIMEVLDYFIN